MTSDFSVFDNPFFSDIPSPSFNNSTSTDSQHDLILQTFQDCLIQKDGNLQDKSADGNELEPTNSLDQIACDFLSTSPPSHQLESLCLEHITPTLDFPNATNSSDISGLKAVKSDVFQIPFEPINVIFDESFVAQRCGGGNAEERPLQRSCSSNFFEQSHSNPSFQPRFDSILESPNSSNSLEDIFPMRSVSSTGDLQRMTTISPRNAISSSSLSTPFMEEPKVKVERYSAEKRKERIERYRAKRSHRNFNKTIKYACRKTLADNRVRVRGRFARNDEVVEAAKKRYEQQDLNWIDGCNGRPEESRRPFYSNSYGSPSMHSQH